MQRFSKLIHDLDQDVSISYKTEVMAAYFMEVPAADAVWALYLLTGRRLKRLVQRSQLFHLIQEEALIPAWLFDECYSVVGDLAETCALLWPDAHVQKNSKNEEYQSNVSLNHWMTERCPRLAGLDPTTLESQLKLWWQGLTRQQIFVATKLLTGGFRTGVAQGLVVKSLAKAFHLPPTYLIEALAGDWPVTAEFFDCLREGTFSGRPSLAPLPFYLASPLEVEPESIGPIEEYCLEWKWDGIRAQIIKYGDHIAIWSRGEELITERFPELSLAALQIADDFVLDGEILAVSGGQVAPFSELQKRIGRKKLSSKVLKAIPVRYTAFDCLGRNGQDLRSEPLRVRRTVCEALLKDCLDLTPSPLLSCTSWDEARTIRNRSRDHGVEGLMIKRWDSVYRMGRKRGDFWKWKIDPMTLDAVLIYAQAGHGRRATLYTDYTFALWKEGQLVPFAKAYSGLDDTAIRELDGWIRKHTLERFGPVRSVEPIRVFEIAFEGIAASPRHKSGIAVRFPRILKERPDKRPDQADSVNTALELISKAKPSS